jgi:uncharacterized protein
MAQHAPVEIVESLEELRTIYREPSSMVQSKVRTGLEQASIEYISCSPFVLVGSSGADGSLDVSPRGGPPGFVSVIDLGRNGSDPYVVLPDLNGNNLLDTFTNVVTTGVVGMLFLVPGQSETLRVNGAAWVSAEPSLMERCAPESFATPKAALVVRPDQVFIHCAKALRRSGLWNPETWNPTAAPDGVRILGSQGLVPPELEDAVRKSLHDGYDTELAQDRL